jgi:hypothetical protein
VTGVGVWFREEITAPEAPQSYSHLILRSFPPSDHEGGTLTFTPSGDGTHVDWLTTYTIPAGSHRRQGDGGGQLPAAQVEPPRDPRWLREGAQELVTANAERIFHSGAGFPVARP